MRWPGQDVGGVVIGVARWSLVCPMMASCESARASRAGPKVRPRVRHRMVPLSLAHVQTAYSPFSPQFPALKTQWRPRRSGRFSPCLATATSNMNTDEGATEQHYFWAGGHFLLLLCSLRFFLAKLLFRAVSSWWYRGTWLYWVACCVAVVQILVSFSQLHWSAHQLCHCVPVSDTSCFLLRE